MEAAMVCNVLEMFSTRGKFLLYEVTKAMEV